MTANAQQADSHNSLAQTFVPNQLQKSVWEFGLLIRSSGPAKGISATVPIPMDWPEQTVKILYEQKSDNVGRLRQSSPTRATRQISFNVNRLGQTRDQSQPNETAEAYLRFEVVKRPQLQPEDPANLKIADPVPGKLKQFLKPSPHIESTHRRIREMAEQLENEHKAAGGWNWVEAIYQHVRENVEYKFDTQIHSCLDALDSGVGDCEELSSLFIAICRASGIPARAVWVPGHTYPEFYLEDETGQGHWIPCQAAGEYCFGQMNEARPILQKGDRFKLPGQRKEVRYVQPSLLAREAAGDLQIEWISREVTEDKESLADSPDNKQTSESATSSK